MNKYTREELDKALLLVSSTITNCEKMQWIGNPFLDKITPNKKLL